MAWNCHQHSLIVSLLCSLFLSLYLTPISCSSSKSGNSFPFKVEPDAKLRAAVERTSGVFRTVITNSNISEIHAKSSYLPDLRRTVLVTVANFGYLNHLQNMLCFTERLGMEPLIVSMDLKLHELLTKKTSYVSYFYDTGDQVNSGQVWLSCPG